MYKTGDMILYNNEGVCRVESISKLDVTDIDGDKLYYNLCPVYGRGSIYVPVDTVLFMRPVIQNDEVQRLISLIPFLEVCPTAAQGKKMLEEQYKQYFQSHVCIDLIRLLKLIYRKEVLATEERKKLGAIDERYKKKAEELLYGEFSIALEIPRQEVKSCIEKKIREMETKKKLSGISFLNIPDRCIAKSR